MKFQLSLTGKNSEKIIQAAIDTGSELPDALLERPVLSARTHFYWNAFTELNSTRGEGCIPWTAIDRYAIRYGVGEESFEELVEMIGALDEVLMKHKDEQRSKK